MRTTFAFICAAALFVGCSRKNDCVGKAKPDCICTMNIDPVCGCDGKTYNNSCEAECAGVKSFTAGACQ